MENCKILPIGSVIEIHGTRKIIIEYIFEEYSYLCGDYPLTYNTHYIIPNKYSKEYIEKYCNNSNAEDCFIKFNEDFKVIFEGYKDWDFDNFCNIMFNNRK